MDNQRLFLCALERLCQPNRRRRCELPQRPSNWVFLLILLWLPARADDLTSQKAEAEKGAVAAQVNLGLVYERGNGVPKDLAEAAKWYRMAAEQRDAYAQWRIGRMYEKGTGISKDLTEASIWYRKAAEQGNPTAQIALGYLYEKGEGVPKDPKEAVNWYKKGAEQGDADAQWFLAQMYEDGADGVPQDQLQALDWYRKAAEQGEADAQWSLGRMYAGGAGVKKDLVEATKWYKLAADQEYAAARAQFAHFTSNNTASQQNPALPHNLTLENGNTYKEATTKLIDNFQVLISNSEGKTLVSLDLFSDETLRTYGVKRPRKPPSLFHPKVPVRILSGTVKTLLDVATDPTRYTGSKIVIEGARLELTTYFNYGYENLRDDYVGFEIKDGTARGYVYASKGDQWVESLRQAALRNGGHVRGNFVIMISSERYSASAGDLMADLLDFSLPNE